MKILIVGKSPTAVELQKMLGSDNDVGLYPEHSDKWEVILICSLSGLDLDELTKVLSAHPEAIRLAQTAIREDEPSWKKLKPSIDDLFLNAEIAWQRLPFIYQRYVLRESRRRQFSAIFESTVEGIMIIDDRGIIKLFNPAAEHIFKYDSIDVLGQNVSILMPEMYSRHHDHYMGNYLKTGKKKIIGIGREVTGRRRDGEEFPMDLAVSEFESEGKKHFAGIVRDVSDRRRLEHEVLRISEQERRRVGQDLHDGLGQMLTGIGLIATNLGNRLEKQGSDLTEDMFEITDLIREADRMSRNIARGLVQVELEGDGMSAALRTLCSNAEKYFSIRCQYFEKGEILLSDSSSASNLFRIAQEAVSNAVKHGRASNITITLESSEDDLVLTIEDDGIGFPEVLSDKRGMGVDIMGYRARVINARLEIESLDNDGTIVRCTLSSFGPEK